MQSGDNLHVTTNLHLIVNWYNALNTKDHLLINNLVNEDTLISGPFGEGEYIEVFLTWLEKSNIFFVPEKLYVRKNIFLVEERGNWRLEGDAISGQLVMFTAFQISQNKISNIVRYNSLGEALHSNGMSEKHLRNHSPKYATLADCG